MPYPSFISPALTDDARTGTSETLTRNNVGQRVTMNNASANTLTVPPNADVPIPTKSQIVVQQLGAGQTSIVAGSGVTIRSRGSYLKLSGQYAVGCLIKDDTNVWTFTGDIMA